MCRINLPIDGDQIHLKWTKKIIISICRIIVNGYHSNNETKSGNSAHSFNKNKQKFRHKFIPRALIFRLSLFQLIYQRITTRPPNIPQWFIFVLFSQFWQYKTCDKIQRTHKYFLYRSCALDSNCGIYLDWHIKYVEDKLKNYPIVLVEKVF